MKANNVLLTLNYSCQRSLVCFIQLSSKVLGLHFHFLYKLKADLDHKAEFNNDHYQNLCFEYGLNISK